MNLSVISQVLFYIGISVGITSASKLNSNIPGRPVNASLVGLSVKQMRDVDIVSAMPSTATHFAACKRAIQRRRRNSFQMVL